MSTRSDSVDAPPSGQTSETKHQASLRWENTLQEMIALELLPFSILCVDANGRVGSNTCKQIGNAQCQMEDVNGFGLRLLVEDTTLVTPAKKKISNKMTGPGGLRKETNIVLTSLALQTHCNRMFTLVLPLMR